jgi:hypothetical protein
MGNKINVEWGKISEQGSSHQPPQKLRSDRHAGFHFLSSVTLAEVLHYIERVFGWLFLFRKRGDRVGTKNAL